MLEIVRRQGVAGATERLQIQADAPNGGYTPQVGVYDGSESLACVIWPGDDQAVTATLAAAWHDAPNGLVSVPFPLDLMTTLDATWYDGMVKLADGSADLIAFRLVVTPGPGAAAAGKVYHSYKDLTDELPWVAKLADQLNDQGGFREVAADSRRWIDAAILRAVPTLDCGSYWLPSYGTWTYQDWVYGSLGLGEDRNVAAALDADQLTLDTATGRRFVQASVCKTLGVILRRAVGMGANNDLLTLSEKYDDMAEKKLASCVAEIGVDADGRPKYVFSLAPRGRLRRA